MDWVTSSTAIKTTITGDPDELAIAARFKHANIVRLFASTTQRHRTDHAGEWKGVVSGDAVLADHGLLRQGLLAGGH